MTKQEFIQWLDGYFAGLGDNPPDVEKIRAKAMEIGEKPNWVSPPTWPQPYPLTDRTLPPWGTDKIWCGAGTRTDATYGYTHWNA